MNGVEIARGASGSISGSTVSGNECDHPSCGTNPVTQTQSAGILLFNNLGQSPVPTVSATNNIVTGNDIGIYSDELTGTTTISGNNVNLNRDEGIYLDEGSASVTNNQITNNGSTPFGAGVIAVQGDFNSQADVNATVTGNTISGNPTVQVQDTCPGVGCPGPPAPPGTPNTTDTFTVHLVANRNAITGNPTIGANNATPSAPYNSTFNADLQLVGFGERSRPRRSRLGRRGVDRRELPRVVDDEQSQRAVSGSSGPADQSGGHDLRGWRSDGDVHAGC